MPSDTVAVIDIGSNSIKVLVAQVMADGTLTALKNKTLDCRISAGISAAEPKLSEDGMARGLTAIQTLLGMAAEFQPQHIQLVATSAVRDATNGADFCARVLAQTGHSVRLLSGTEEANLIGRGLGCDPGLSALKDFYVFDLGGGSLECLTFRDRHIVQAESLRLGCVRMTERFFPKPSAPLPLEQCQHLADFVQQSLQQAQLNFSLPAPAQAVFTGGTVTTLRVLHAASKGLGLSDTPARVSVASVAALLDKVAPLDLAGRLVIPGMPAARADVFPAALITVLAVAKSARIDSFQHSLHNLRWGVAAELATKLDQRSAPADVS